MLDLLFELLNRPFLQIGEMVISLSGIAQCILLLLFIFILKRSLEFLLKRFILKRLGIDTGNQVAIATIFSYGFSAFTLVAILQGVGFDLGALAVVMGGLGIGVGFGIQNIVKDVISGFTLLFERNIKVGDFLEFDGSVGHVKKISLRSVQLKTLDGGDVIIPNNHLTDHRVLNWSLESFSARIHIPVAVAYGTDPVLVTELLLKSAEMGANVCATPAPKVICLGSRDDPNGALEFELLVWIEPVDQRLAIKSALQFIIHHNFQQHGINIPFCENWLRNLEVMTAKTSLWEDKPALQAFYNEPLREIADAPITLRDRLQQISLFETLTDLELRHLIEVGRRRRLKSGEVLFHEGDPGDAFYVILSGGVNVVAEKLDKVLATLTQGQFFGEVALMLGIPRTAMIQAMEDTIVFEVNQQGFGTLLKHYPDLTEVIVQALGNHKEELQQRQQQLRDLGLVDEQEDDLNVINWARKRLVKLFGLQLPSVSIPNSISPRP